MAFIFPYCSSGSWPFLDLLDSLAEQQFDPIDLLQVHLLEQQFQGLVKRLAREATALCWRLVLLLDDFTVDSELDLRADRYFELLAEEQKLGELHRCPLIFYFVKSYRLFSR